jgi:sulfur carrier protein
MDLLINGQTRRFDALPPKPRIADLVAALGMQADRVAIEQNGEIVPRGEWADAGLQHGDKLEIVHFVGGGRC